MRRNKFFWLSFAFMLCALSMAMVVYGGVSYPSLGYKGLILPGRTVSIIVEANYDSTVERVVRILPKHDGWIEGSEDYVSADPNSFLGATTFSQKQWTIRIWSGPGDSTRIDIERAWWPIL